MASTSFKSIVLLPLILLTTANGCATAARQLERAARPASEDRTRPLRRERAVPPPAVDGANIAVRPGHPRLFVGADWPAATDTVSRDWQAILIKRADDLAGKPLVAYSAKKLLTRSREALKRLSLYAGVYRFTHDKKYAELGRRELLNVCGFDDWNPDDFLATAEMMTAVSIAYDWLYDALPPDDRSTVVSGIVRNGLKPALHEYDIQSGWTRATHNWSCVCNGGVIVASLAVAEEEPAVAQRALGNARASIESGLSIYDNGGGTVEGPMYHSYATRYLTFAAAAMETAIPPEARVSLTNAAEGAGRFATGAVSFRNWTLAGDYRLAMTGPTGKSANFGDSSELLGNTAWMLYLSQFESIGLNRGGFQAEPARVDRYTAFQADADRGNPSIFDLLWYRTRVIDGTLVGIGAGGVGAGIDPLTGNAISATPGKVRTGVIPVPLSRQVRPPFTFASAVVLRPPTDDPNAPFLALRTGSTADHHSHLDLGNFVLDMLGQRFAADLGPDEYGLPGYFDKRRADYLRTSTPGHNTLTIGEAGQPGDAEATATVKTDGGVQSARIDLSAAYPTAKSVIRTATLDGNVVTIADDIRTGRDGTFVWHLHTPAKVKPVAGGARLDVNGKQVDLIVLEPAGAKLTIEADATRPPQRPVDGMTHVRVRVPVDGRATIRVQFRPHD